MNNLKKDFPFFAAHSDLTYLDNAATTQKPQAVVDALSHFYIYDNAPVHRGIYKLAEQTTLHYEKVREQIARYVNATDSSEIIFTSGTTESLNMVVQSWAFHALKAGDEIILSQLEHHANLIPWLYLAQERNLHIKWIEVKDGLLDSVQALTLFTHRTKVLALSSNSNLFGYELEITSLITQAKKFGTYVVIDAAQAAGRTALDVQKLGCDFLAFSSHKMMGPTGVGVLYCNKKMHDHMHPYQLGGSMVYEVTFEKAAWRPLPYRMEAGTPPIAQVIGLGAALDYIQKNIDFEILKKHEALLCNYFITEVASWSRLHILGNKEKLKKSGHLISFTIEGMHPHDTAALLDQYGICVRAGHHCVQPMHTLLGITGSVRASFYAYTTQQDIEALLKALQFLA